MSATRKDRPDFVPHHEEYTVLETGTHRITASMSIREVPFPNMDGPTYLIEYRGKDGSATKREIVIQWINRKKDIFWITAYCKLRKEVRNFKSDNIISMSDVVSGRIIVDPAEPLRRLYKHGF